MNHSVRKNSQKNAMYSESQKRFFTKIVAKFEPHISEKIVSLIKIFRQQFLELTGLQKSLFREVLFEIANIYLRSSFWLLRSRIYRVFESYFRSTRPKNFFDTRLSANDRKEHELLIAAKIFLSDRLQNNSKKELFTFINIRHEYPYSLKQQLFDDVWRALTDVKCTGTFFEIVVVQNLVSMVIWRMKRTLTEGEIEHIDEIWTMFANQMDTIADLDPTHNLSYCFMQFLIDELSFERLEFEWKERLKSYPEILELVDEQNHQGQSHAGERV